MTSPDSDRFSNLLYYLILLQACVISVSVAAGSILLALSFATAIVWMLRSKEIVFRRTPFDYFFLAYCGIELLTAATAVFPSEAFVNSKRLLLIGFLYFAAQSFDSRKKFERAGMVFATVIGVLSLVEIVLFRVEHEGRLSIFQHYMTAGGLKMIGCLFIVPFLVERNVVWKMKLWLAASFVPTFVALLLTSTRSSWLGFLGGCIIVGIGKSRILLAAILGAVIIFFLTAPAGMIDRAKSIVDISHPNNIGRVHMWETGAKIFADHPILGVGDSDLHEIYNRYRMPGDSEVGGHLHDNYLMLLVTIGVFGFSVVMALFIRIIVFEIRSFVAHRDDWLVSSIVLGALAVFVGFLINGLFEWNFGDHEIMTLVWLSVGLSLAAVRLREKETV